jgi:NDP-sugar pyrophosphorylase family protein
LHSSEFRIATSATVRTHYKPGIPKFHDDVKALATVVATVSDRLYHYWAVRFDETTGRVLGFVIRSQEYRSRPQERAAVLTGMLILHRDALHYADMTISGDFPGIVQPLVHAQELHVYISPSDALFDVGTPEEFQEAKRYFGDSGDCDIDCGTEGPPARQFPA